MLACTDLLSLFCILYSLFFAGGSPHLMVCAVRAAGGCFCASHRPTPLPRLKLQAPGRTPAPPGSPQQCSHVFHLL